MDNNRHKPPVPKPELVLRVIGAQGRQASLDDWIEGKLFTRWDDAGHETLSKRDSETLEADGWFYVELWRTNPLVQRVCRIRL